jgi:hypothetical protein
LKIQNLTTNIECASRRNTNTLRRREPPAAVSEEFTGQAFYTWRLRRQPPENHWRVAAQLVDGFAMLNSNAAALFSAPAQGLRT